MRVRPFFWIILALSCIGVCMMGAMYPRTAPIQLHLSLDQPYPLVEKSSTITLHLTDTQGIPIDDASAISTINMLNMDMGETSHRLQARGKGIYSMTFQWSMAGPWSMTVHVNARGFQTGTSQLYVNVV